MQGCRFGAMAPQMAPKGDLRAHYGTRTWFASLALLNDCLHVLCPMSFSRSLNTGHGSYDESTESDGSGSEAD